MAATKTTTETVTYADRIAQQETEQTARAVAADERLAADRALNRQHSDLASEYADRASSLKRQWSNPEFTGEYATASEVQRIGLEAERSLAIAGATLSRLRSAAKARAARTASVSEILAAALADLFAGATIVTTFGTAPKPLPEDYASGPLLVLADEVEAVRGDEGYLSGEVTVSFFRSTGHRDLEQLDIDDELYRHGIRADVQRVRAGETEDTATIKVDICFPGTPVIDGDPNETLIARVGANIAYDVIKPYCSGRNPQASLSGRYSTPNGALVTERPTGSIRSTVNGTTRTTVLHIAVPITGNLSAGAEALSSVCKRVGTAMEGTAIGGLGRIVSVVAGGGVTDGAHGQMVRGADMTITAESKTA